MEVAAIVKEFTFLKPHYRVEGMNLDLEGDFWAHDYTLLQNGAPVMRMTKEWFTWGDSYVMDIAPGADELVCLCVALAVDCAIQSQNNN